MTCGPYKQSVIRFLGRGFTGSTPQNLKVPLLQDMNVLTLEPSYSDSVSHQHDELTQN